MKVNNMKVYKVLDYSNVNSCESASGEVLSILEELNKDEVLQVIVDQEWKLNELREFLGKTKYKILDVEKRDGKIVITIGGR